MDQGFSVKIRPALNVAGSLHLPGDKSISHRYAMLAALAEGTTHLENFSDGQDCASTLACLAGLGVALTRDAGKQRVEIQGSGHVLSPPTRPLDCGNSGSTMRLLSGLLAGQAFTSDLVGDKSLSRRPMARVIKPLTAMGARIASAGDDRPPLHITGGPLTAIDYAMPLPSAQVKSAILFAGLLAAGETRVRESVRTRDHGELALRAFGADLKQQGSEVSIAGGQKLNAMEARIPGDISSAAFFLCAAALFPGSQLTITDLLLNPTRARLLDVLIAMGAQISINELEEHHGEFVGTVFLQGRSLKGATITGSDVSALIDELPVLAAIGPHTQEGIEIRDARELRVKESDRIALTVANLRAMGAEVKEYDDGLGIPGRQKLHSAKVASAGDHRIAMAFAITALRAEGEIEIGGAEAAAVSYPGFYEALESLAVR